MPAHIRIISAGSPSMAFSNSRVSLFPSGKEFSSTLQTYNIGLSVNSIISTRIALPSSSVSKFRAGWLFSRCFSKEVQCSTALTSSLLPLLACFLYLSNLFSTVSMSFRINSKSMISLSLTGFTLPSTCTTLSSSKQRTTCNMASTSLILPKN